MHTAADWSDGVEREFKGQVDTQVYREPRGTQKCINHHVGSYCQNLGNGPREMAQH